MIGQDIYDALPNILHQGRVAKHGGTLVGPAAVAFLVSNGYKRCSRKYGVAVRHTDTAREHDGKIVFIPWETLAQLPHRSGGSR